MNVAFSSVWRERAEMEREERRREERDERRGWEGRGEERTGGERRAEQRRGEVCLLKQSQRSRQKVQLVLSPLLCLQPVHTLELTGG